MFPLIETIKVIDGKLQNLKWHQNRFEASYYKFYKKLATVKLEQVISVPKEHGNGIVKLRFLYNASDCFCQFDAYELKKINFFQLVSANSISYDLKYVDRKALDSLRKNSGADEIIIVKNGMITDTSFSNLIFYDGKDWHTPKYPLLYGTARARLLHEKRIIATEITVDDLQNYQSFQLINAMIDKDVLQFSVDILK